MFWICLGNFEEIQLHYIMFELIRIFFTERLHYITVFELIT